MAKERTQFCIGCREETTYRIQPVSCRKCIKDKEYEFVIAEAVCEKCGEAVNIPGLMDRNAQEVDRQYRLQEGIVSIDDIYDLISEDWSIRHFICIMKDKSRVTAIGNCDEGCNGEVSVNLFFEHDDEKYYIDDIVWWKEIVLPLEEK